MNRAKRRAPRKNYVLYSQSARSAFVAFDGLTTGMRGRVGASGAGGNDGSTAGRPPNHDRAGSRETSIDVVGRRLSPPPARMGRLA